MNKLKNSISDLQNKIAQIITKTLCINCLFDLITLYTLFSVISHVHKTPAWNESIIIFYGSLMKWLIVHLVVGSITFRSWERWSVANVNTWIEYIAFFNFSPSAFSWNPERKLTVLQRIALIHWIAIQTDVIPRK